MLKATIVVSGMLKATIFESLIILTSLGSWKSKGLTRISKID